MMTDEDLQAIIASELEDAISFIDSDIGPERAKAVDYYFGRPFGDEEEGRSKVVSRDVHDMIQAALPSLMRMFFGPERVVEFGGRGAEDEALAAQITDYIGYIVTQDNPGFEVFLAAIKNALREKVGFVKYWWDDSVKVTTKRFTGLDDMALAQLDQEVEEAGGEIVESHQGEPTLDPATQTEGPGLWSVKVRLKAKRDLPRIEAVPPEELLISRRARALDTAPLVAHRTMKTVSDLVAMGLDRDLVEAAVSDADDLKGSEERLARNPHSDGLDTSAVDPSMREVLYIEAYPLVDFDDDGIAELRKVCTIGTAYKIVVNEEVDERPFADFHVDPEPHTFFGESLADKTMDVQGIKSRVLRAGLDSLAMSNFPRMRVGTGGNLDDALNTEIGAILRGNAGDYEAITTPDLSGAAMPYLSYMDELRENRTGMSKVSMGLDATALQNTTATAAEGQFTRSQERIELYGRILASGIRRLYRGLLHLVVENQRKERVVQLRNKWVPINPSAWRTDMDVKCTLGLGGGTPQEKMARLTLIAQKQEQIIQTLGLVNPLVTVGQYRHTLAKMIELGGESPDAFFMDPTSEEAQQQLAQMQQKPDPKMAEAQQRLQVEQLKIDGQLKLQAAKVQGELEITRAKTAADIETQRQRGAMELQLQRDLASVKAQGERDQAAAELDLKKQEMDMEFALKAEDQARSNLLRTSGPSSAIDGPTVGGAPG
jgi:hypothetical protein